jgi:hypothetical protein
MRHVIEVEETVKIRHQIVVDIGSEGQLEEALDSVDGSYICDLDDYVEAISEVVPVVEVNANCVMETWNIEYFDDYMCEDDD